MYTRARLASLMGLGAYLTLSAFVLASCGGSAPQAASFHRDRSASTPSSHTPSPAASRAVSRAPTTAQPVRVQAVRRFIAAVNRAFASRDPRELEALSARGCQSCRNLIRLVRGLAHGWRHEGRLRWSVVDVGPVAGSRDVQAYLKLAPYRVVPPRGGGGYHGRGGVVLYEFMVRRKEGGWLVAGILDET